MKENVEGNQRGEKTGYRFLAAALEPRLAHVLDSGGLWGHGWRGGGAMLAQGSGIKPGPTSRRGASVSRMARSPFEEALLLSTLG